MILLDKAQRKLMAGFMEKLSVALATAVAAKIFFSEEGMTLLTLYAAILMIIILVVGMLLVRGTEDKPKDVIHTVGKPMARKHKR